MTSNSMDNQAKLDVTDHVFDSLESRVLTHWHEAKMILEGKMPPPRTGIIYPTYVCNQDCLWCEYSAENSNHELNRIMPADKLYELMWALEDLGVRAVEFCGGGEPTLHPALGPLIREMNAKGMSVGLLTNGTKLKGELASALVDCAGYVRVGFDAATKQTFQKVKRPKTPEAQFEAVCRNVKELLRLRDERGTRARISMKAVLDANNYMEVEDCVKLAVELGVDSVQFKAARLVSSELTPGQSDLVNAKLDQYRKEYPEMVIVGSASKLDMTSQCWLTPLQLTVDALGEVYLCCYYLHRKDSHSIGNCFESPVSDLWYSERHWEAVRNIKRHECNKLDCRFVKYNKIMNEVMLDNDAQFEFI